MKSEISQSQMRIARGVRELVQARGLSREELARRLGHPPRKVTRQLEGKEPWTRSTNEKYFVALGIDSERIDADPGTSAWEYVEALGDEVLEAKLRGDLPDPYKY